MVCGSGSVPDGMIAVDLCMEGKERMRASKREQDHYSLGAYFAFLPFKGKTLCSLLREVT